jgi:hypothetical protein
MTKFFKNGQVGCALGVYDADVLLRMENCEYLIGDRSMKWMKR